MHRQIKKLMNMFMFGKIIAPGISGKVLLGLVLIVLMAVVSSIVTKFYLDKSALLFKTISSKQIPLLIVSSKLAKETNGLILNGYEVIITKNNLLIDSISHNTTLEIEKIQEMIFELKLANINEVPELSLRIQQIADNLSELEQLVKENIESNTRIVQILIYIRQTTEALIMSGLQRDASSRFLRELFIQIFSLLRDVPNISDNQQFKEYQNQIFSLKKRVDNEFNKRNSDSSNLSTSKNMETWKNEKIETWKNEKIETSKNEKTGTLKNENIKTSNVTDLEISESMDLEMSELARYYLEILNHYGIGEKGILALAETQLMRNTLIHNKLAEISFLSDELVKQTGQLFSNVSNEIETQSQKVTNEIYLIGMLFMLIPVLIFISAIFIFIFIRRSVIRRILSLDRKMKAHVQGNPIYIPIEGNDEITSMAKSVSFFVEKRNEYETTLQDARLAAERANQAKSLFLAKMSHELRTPLNAILGFIQLLIRKNHPSFQDTEYLDIIRSNGEHLLSMINQMLDFSVIEAGRLVIKESNFELHTLLDEIKDAFKIRTVNKKLSLIFERGDNVPHFIRTDPVKLKQILINLLNNAFKFTEKGGIIVRVAFIPLRLYFEVEDLTCGLNALQTCQFTMYAYTLEPFLTKYTPNFVLKRLMLW
ncbi:MAG: hypothetical protein HQK67_04395, partial [Desulfamplus sp.]|nr:hypothetical protein [Desulfamplus sp.]